MASSGQASFTLNRDQLIAASMRTLRVLQDGQTPSVNQITNGSEALNTLITNWQSNGLQLWTYQWLEIPCQVNKYVYTIGPSAADVTNVRPLKLMEDGCFIRNTVGGIQMDTPLIVLSRTDYANFGNKQSQGTTNSIYYQPGIDSGLVTSPSVGYGTLYLYCNPTDTTHTIIGNFQRPIYVMNNSTDEFDFPAEWFLALRYGLAEILADEYEVPDGRLLRVREQAEKHHQKVQDWSVEESKFRFQPDFRMGSRWPSR
jgi:hypothetical protein